MNCTRLLLAFLLVLAVTNARYNLRYLQLPARQMRRLFFSNTTLRNFCLEEGPAPDPDDGVTGCPYHDMAMNPRPWGFEDDCSSKDLDTAKSRIKCKDEKDVDKFWWQADFGYIRNHASNWVEYCKARGASSLTCNSHLQFCKATNLAIDFRKIKDDLLKSTKQYRSDLVKDKGIIEANCKMDWKAFEKQADRRGFLSSWAEELLKLTERSEPVFDLDTPRQDCDLVVDKPAFIVKLDAGVNMFHHFCDFINIFATQAMLGHLDKNILIVNWHTSVNTYYDPFHMMWQAFTWYQPVQISEWAQKRVCFRQAYFPLLPRLYFGLYYNMPLVKNCERSSLFKAFHDVMAHRMNLTQKGPLKGTVRVTLLHRETAHRNIRNGEELKNAVEKIPGVLYKEVTYSMKMPFEKQLEITYNSDVFIGMHGAGLTHCLFLPDWAVLFELHNCEDADCYMNLAKMRGVHYMTWEKDELAKRHGDGKHPISKSEHAKFFDYEFDPAEYGRLVKKAVAYVREHPTYQNALRTNKDQDATITERGGHDEL